MMICGCSLCYNLVELDVISTFYFLIFPQPQSFRFQGIKLTCNLGDFGRTTTSNLIKLVNGAIEPSSCVTVLLVGGRDVMFQNFNPDILVRNCVHCYEMNCYFLNGHFSAQIHVYSQAILLLLLPLGCDQAEHTWRVYVHYIAFNNLCKGYFR